MSREKDEAAAERKMPGVEKLLRQFMHTQPHDRTAYRIGWARTFGRKTQEHGDLSIGEKVCSDEHCWCKT